MYSPNFALYNLFQTHPSTDFVLWKWAVGLGILLFFGSWVFTFFRRGMHNPIVKKMAKGYDHWMRVVGGIILLLTWLRLEGIPYFSMRIWWIVLALIVLGCSIREAIEWKKACAAAKAMNGNKEPEKKKYIPGLKKGRK